MKLSNTFNRLRWRHWLLLSLLVLVLVIKWSPYLGYIYTLYIYSTIGRILSSFSGIFPFAIGDIFIALSIFVQPPSVEELRRRLNGRGTDAPEVIEQRLAKANYELTFAPQFDHIVVNDNLEKAEQEVYKLVSDFLNQE